MKRLLAVALCLCLLLAGCGGTETGYTPTGNGLVWDEDYTGVATQPASAEGEDALELVLTFYPDKTMNPITCTDFTNRALFSLI